MPSSAKRAQLMFAYLINSPRYSISIISIIPLHHDIWGRKIPLSPIISSGWQSPPEFVFLDPWNLGLLRNLKFTPKLEVYTETWSLLQSLELLGNLEFTPNLEVYSETWSYSYSNTWSLFRNLEFPKKLNICVAKMWLYSTFIPHSIFFFKTGFKISGCLDSSFIKQT